MLDGFNELEGGELSAAQADGRVQPGDFIVAVNDTPMAAVPYALQAFLSSDSISQPMPHSVYDTG